MIYGSSGTLARQISLGAPADIFFSANGAWIDYLEGKNIVRSETRRTVVTNKLVLIASLRTKPTAIVKLSEDIPRLLGDTGRLAMGDPRHVPAGKYARDSLEFIGIWDSIEPRIVRTRNVRHALALVQRSEAPLGIVYRSDVQNDGMVHVLTALPSNLHSPIAYEAVATLTRRPETDRFLSFLNSTSAERLYREAGFGIPEKP